MIGRTLVFVTVLNFICSAGLAAVYSDPKLSYRVNFPDELEACTQPGAAIATFVFRPSACGPQATRTITIQAVALNPREKSPLGAFLKSQCAAASRCVPMRWDIRTTQYQSLAFERLVPNGPLNITALIRDNSSKESANKSTGYSITLQTNSASRHDDVAVFEKLVASMRIGVDFNKEIPGPKGRLGPDISKKI